MKKAILVVSFGTSHPDTLDQTIGAVEDYAREYFPDEKVYRAFTSRRIIELLQKRYDIYVDSLEDAMKRMEADGISRLVVQPTYVVHGAAWYGLKEELKRYESRFETLKLGAPLLNRPEDYKACVHAMIDEWGLDKDEIIVIAGHGTQQYAQSAYTMLEYMFHTLGYTNVLVGTVRGFPDINNVTAKLALLNKKKIRIIPFMIVSGEHVRTDLAEGEDSWTARFERLGFRTEVMNHGLGEMQGIRRIFAEHMKEAMES